MEDNGVNLPCALCGTDAKGFIRWYDEAAVSLWGCRPQVGQVRWSGAMGMYTEDGVVLTPEEGPVAMALQGKGEVPGRIIVVERPDGTRRRVLSRPRPVLDSEGRVTGVVDVLTDLTDEQPGLPAETTVKRGELKQGAEWYRRMISEVQDYAILLLDAGGVIQNWNKGAENIKGYSEAEIVGQHFRVFYTPSDQEARLPEQLIDQAATTGKAIHEGWRRRKNGTLFWGSIVITALHDQVGQVIGFSKVTRDLTERREVEEQMKRYSAELEFQNRELQQFAYAAAHDMKEPLRKLSFYNASLVESLEGRLSERDELYLRRSTDAAIRMQRLIDDLLAYAKASTAGGPLMEVAMEVVVSDAMAMYQEMIEETGACLEVTSLPKVWGIPFQLRQLVENLLGNALKYRDSSRSPVIRIEGTQGRYAPEGNDAYQEYVRITMSDNGIGFDTRKAEKMFDIFQRLNNERNLPGTGIGLAICRRVVQNHNGFIHAEAQPGQGATFTVYLRATDGSLNGPHKG